MADFVAVLKKTIDGLPDNTPQARARIYERARATIEAKLAALDPQPPQAVADRQRQVLANAIEEVEAHYAPAEPEEEMLDGAFDDVFDMPAPAVAAPPVAPSPAPAPQRDAFFPAPPRAQEKPAGSEQPAWMADGPQDDIRPERSERLAPHAAATGNDNDVEDDDPLAPPARRERRVPRGLGRLLVAAAIVVALAGAGYGLWLNRDDLMAMVFGDGEVAVTEQAPAGQAPAGQTPPAGEQVAAAAPEQPAAPTAQPAPAASGKFTQRLTSDGNEIDTGPAGQPASVGEGTSVAAATQPSAPPAASPSAPAAPAAPQAPASGNAVAVGQQAMFYEERTTSAAGTAERGSTVWSVVQESPGGDQPPEPAIRGEVVIPDRDLQLRVTIRRNADQSLPASHIIEMIFLTPDDFSGGGINNVLRITMKPTEEDPGSALFGIPAKIADGFFLLALSDRAAEAEANTAMLRRQGWIDIPIVYRSGRRALVTLEKGLPGERAFNEAMDAWQAASSGSPT